MRADLFLDNDRSGDGATEKIKAQIDSRDIRQMYSPHNDVNDFLMGQSRLKR